MITPSRGRLPLKEGMSRGKTYEYAEGREAFERFRNAVKTVLSVPKSALFSLVS